MLSNDGGAMPPVGEPTPVTDYVMYVAEQLAQMKQLPDLGAVLPVQSWLFYHW